MILQDNITGRRGEAWRRISVHVFTLPLFSRSTIARFDFAVRSGYAPLVVASRLLILFGVHVRVIRYRRPRPRPSAPKPPILHYQLISA